MRWTIPLLALLAITAAGCASTDTDSATAQSGSAREYRFPPAPAAPDGPLDAPVKDALDAIVSSATEGRLDREALDTVAASKDARLAWFISDLLRFIQGGEDGDA